MKVSKDNLNTAPEQFDFIISEIYRIGSDIPWDLPPNVLKCRNIYYARLIRKLEVLLDTEEAQEYQFKVPYDL
jgi:hypothetical protein